MMPALRVLYFILVVQLLLAGCASPKDAPPFEVRPDLLVDLTAHTIVRLHVLTWREKAPPREPFPAAGFRFNGFAVVPDEKPGTAAGAVLTEDQLAVWLRGLRDGGAIALMSPTFTIWSDRSAGTADREEVNYVSNWAFSKGAAMPVYATRRPGMNVELRPLVLTGTDHVLLRVAATAQRIGLRDYTVSGGFRIKRGKAAAPLQVDLPHEYMQRLTTAVPVRRGASRILLHAVTQRRTPAGGGVRDHLFYIATLTVVGKEPDYSESEPAPMPETYALDLFWWQAAPEPETPPPAETVADVLRWLREHPEPAVEMIGVAAIAGEPAGVEYSEARDYVAGLPEEPAEKRTFDLRTAHSGIWLEMRPADNASRALAVTGRASEIGPARVIEQTLPSLRTAAGEDVSERYAFESHRGANAEFSHLVGLNSPDPVWLSPHWRHFADDPAAPPSRVVGFMALSVRALPDAAAAPAGPDERSFDSPPASR